MAKSKEPPQRKAAALAYEPEKDRAPRLTAKGRGVVAENIISLARKHGIPVRQDPVLVEMLSRLDLDREIPPELYHAVAEILAYLYRMNERARDGS